MFSSYKDCQSPAPGPDSATGSSGGSARVSPLPQGRVAALPGAGLQVVVVGDVLQGGRGGRRAAPRAAAASPGAQLHLPPAGRLVGVGHRGAGGQVGVVGGRVELRSHLLLQLLLLLVLLVEGQSQDLITQRQPAAAAARELPDLLGLLQGFWQEEQVGQTPHDPAMLEEPAVCRGHRLQEAGGRRTPRWVRVRRRVAVYGRTDGETGPDRSDRTLSA